MQKILSGLLFLTLPAFSAPAEDLDLLPVQDRNQLFADAGNRTGVARKTRDVLARPAVPGEIVVTLIRGEGEETRSKPAEAGDWVVQNICDATGNEEILVKKRRLPAVTAVH
ncbi:hypothetical protein Q4R62_15545 [Morganella morganii]